MSETERKKKKLIRVTDSVEFHKTYPNISYTSFAFVSHPDDGRRQCISFKSCRENVCSILRNAVRGDVSLSSYKDEYPRIDLNKTRVLVGRNTFGDDDGKKEYKRNLFSGKAAINYYEDLAGWKRSKITTVKHDALNFAWMITGPKEWLSYPSLFSMFALILRVSSHNGPVEFETGDDLSTFWDRLVEVEEEKLNSEYLEVDNDVVTFLKPSKDFFEFLMKKYKDIFIYPFDEGYPFMRDYDSSKYNFSINSGIYNLCMANTGVQSLDERFKKVYKKYVGETEYKKHFFD